MGLVEIVRILAPLTGNPNAPDGYGQTPLYWAAQNGHTEIVKILVSLTNNPNAPDKDGDSPSYWAAKKGHTEIVKILAPLTNNPNAPSKYGDATPICWAELLQLLSAHYMLPHEWESIHLYLQH